MEIKDIIKPDSELSNKLRQSFVELDPQTGAQRFEEERLFFTMQLSNDTKGNLEKVSVSSLVIAFRKLAQSGLTIDPEKGIAYLIPKFSNISLQMGLNGKVDRMSQNGGPVLTHQDVIYKGEEYSIENGKVVSHKVDLELRSKTPLPEILAGYVVGELPNGGGEVHGIGYMNDFEYSKKKSNMPNSPLYTDRKEAAFIRCAINKIYKLSSKGKVNIFAPNPNDKELSKILEEPFFSKEPTNE
jgi:recombinational DNA repair protein RecT